MSLFAEDLRHCHPLPDIAFDLSGKKGLTTNGWGKFYLNKGMHEYSVSPRHANTAVNIKLTSSLVIAMDENYREIVRHRRFYGDTKQQSMNWLPYLKQLALRPLSAKPKSNNPRSIFNFLLYLLFQLPSTNSFNCYYHLFITKVKESKKNFPQTLSLRESMVQISKPPKKIYRFPLNPLNNVLPLSLSEIGLTNLQLVSMKNTIFQATLHSLKLYWGTLLTATFYGVSSLSFAVISSRKAFFDTFPTLVKGNSLTTSNLSGSLNFAIFFCNRKFLRSSKLNFNSSFKIT